MTEIVLTLAGLAVGFLGGLAAAHRLVDEAKRLLDEANEALDRALALNESSLRRNRGMLDK